MKYTYFIREVESGLMKIGSTDTPQSRFQNLQVSSPRDLEFVLATTLVTEKECHRRFAESKIRGEWFLPGADMDAFLSELMDDAKKYPAHFFTAKAEQLETEQEQSQPQSTSRTRIVFDLRDELTPEEIAQFEENAAKAGSSNLTEHFLSLTLRLQKAATEGGAQ